MAVNTSKVRQPKYWAKWRKAGALGTLPKQNCLLALIEKMQAQGPLFAGEPEPFGGLSNEDELARLCPKEFHRGNPWSNYVSKLFFCGDDISNWKWKSSDNKEKAVQLGYFDCLLRGFGLKHEDKEAVAGWMLSEMLTEVPKHLAKTG